MTMIGNKAFRLGAFSLLAYWFLAPLFPADTPKQVFTGVSVGISMVILWTWKEGAWEALKDGIRTPFDQLLISVYGTWGYIFLTRFYAAVFYLLDEPRWLSESHVLGFLGLICCSVGLLSISAPGFMPDAIKGRWKLHMIVAIALGIIIAMFMLGIDSEATVGLAQV